MARIEIKTIKAFKNPAAFLKKLLAEISVINPNPRNTEQTAVAGDILPGYFEENLSDTNKLSIENTDHPVYSNRVNTPIMTMIRANE